MSAEIEDFYRHLYFPLVKRVQWRFHLPKEDARDVVQDAFAIALTKLDASMNPKAWLIQVVDYLSANACRKARRRAFLYARWAGSPEGLGVVSEG